ncbi:glycoside hydrolase family 10 protein [Siphonobacter curvatus]|uniref:Glycoside hydrolase n=1 Tax=Siphonobacter curvatus TaxID=2094562 RepID=A0A2S7IIW8_9BACT|nr:family 10 glycosylhydrolase [Siphonobacter curvatus]PQA56264.1 glycoside hydrolase [Siphonobacter curvatus]
MCTRFFFLVLVFCGWQAFAQQSSPKRELRAVWIATVDNIDWPRPGDYNPNSQQQSFRQILNNHRQSGMNAIFVQVRDAADAYYAKGATEPWSEWLTGRQGRAPEPFYDPLEFMIAESHQRNLEFHAWLNLNRAVFKGHPNVTPDHVSRQHPDWMLTYDGTKFFNVGVPEVRNYITSIVTNLVRNYDLDGIHFDDYFYPYKVVGQVLNDQVTFYKYGAGYANIHDWRRDNINQLIHQISDSVKVIKPYVKFGISPFGIWRNRSSLAPDGSETRGLSSYDDLYADTRKWLQMGWIDYIAPQVYFHRGHKRVPYEPLVDWWRKNCFGRHLYIGQGAYRMNGESGWDSPDEMPIQIRFNRQHSEIQGSIYFSSRSLLNNYKGFQDTLRRDLYRLPALVPTMPWKDHTPPLPPQEFELKRTPTQVLMRWQMPPAAVDGEVPRRFVVYRFRENEPIILNNTSKILAILPVPQTSYADTPPTPGNYRYVVTALDRLQNESYGVMTDVEVQ